MKRYAILGYTQSGKSTVGQMIAEATGGKAASISDYIKRMYEDAMELGGGETDVAWELSNEAQRQGIRGRLYNFARGIEYVQPLFIIDQMVSEDINIVCGMRTEEELRVVCKLRVFDEYWWVDWLKTEQGPTDAVNETDIVREIAEFGGATFRRIDSEGTDGSREAMRKVVLEALGKESP